jgi:hypothetical protein
MRNPFFKVALWVATCIISLGSFGQGFDKNPLDKMPPALETEFALSALPPHLRANATVYLLDPKSGFYIGQQGSNGFVCFVSRTEWQWGEYRNDLGAAIAYDAEGARTVFKVYQQVAIMRASGKYSAIQLRDAILDSIRQGVYKAPARVGISYMLAPVMRVYTGKPDDKTVMTMHMPHYMFYAPYLTASDIGTNDDQWPVLVTPDELFLGERKGPYSLIIVPVGKMEKDEIVNSNKELLAKLIAYKSYFKVDSDMAHH